MSNIVDANLNKLVNSDWNQHYLVVENGQICLSEEKAHSNEIRSMGLEALEVLATELKASNNKINNEILLNKCWKYISDMKLPDEMHAFQIFKEVEHSLIRLEENPAHSKTVWLKVNEGELQLKDYEFEALCKDALMLKGKMNFKANLNNFEDVDKETFETIINILYRKGDVGLINSKNIALLDHVADYLDIPRLKQFLNIWIKDYLPQIEFRDLVQLFKEYPSQIEIQDTVPTDTQVNILKACELKLSKELREPKNKNQFFERLDDCRSYITHLDLNGLDWLDDEHIEYLANCPHLQILDLSDCRKMTNQSLAPLQKCDKLKRLDLWDCPEIKQKDLELPNIERVNWGLLSDLSSNKELQGNKDFFLYIFGRTLKPDMPEKHLLLYADPELKKDKEVVLAAIRTDWYSLKFADPELQKDKEVVLAAIRLHGCALAFAAPELKKDKEIVIAAVGYDARAIHFTHPDLRKDRDVFLAIVRLNGTMLHYASEELKNDKEVVLAAVGQNGLVLQYASTELKKDKEVVLTAIRQNGLALRYADPELRIF